MAPVLDVEQTPQAESHLALHDSPVRGIGYVLDEVAGVVVAGYEVGVVVIKLLPYCLDEGGRIGEPTGPDVSVLVLIVLHPI